MMVVIKVMTKVGAVVMVVMAVVKVAFVIRKIFFVNVLRWYLRWW